MGELNQLPEISPLETEADLLDPKKYIENLCWVRSKQKKIVPFRFNVVQIQYYYKRTLRDLVFKARQHGFTTFILALFLHDTMTNEGVNTKIVAHKRKAAEVALETVKLMYNRIDPELRPKIKSDNKYEFTFPTLNSKITIESAVKTAGRSETIHNLLCTEVAFWPNSDEMMTALMEAVPEEAGNIVMESTPNGVGDRFYQEVQKARTGEGEFKLHEFPWWANPEYQLILKPGEKLEPYTEEEARLMVTYKLTPAQMKWRRKKIARLGKRKFAREYECDFLQSGTPVFSAEAINNWPTKKTVYQDNYLRVWELPVKGERYALGVDTSEGLEDGDKACAQVLKMSTWEQVAVLHGALGPTVLAAKVDKLARQYRQGNPYGAIVGVERNNHGHAVLVKMVDFQTPGLFFHQPQRPGWDTNSATKFVMIDELEEGIRKGLLTVYDQATKGELLAYEWKPNGSAGAPDGEGNHDDTVVGTAIAWQMRKATAWQIWEPGGGGEELTSATVLG